MPPTCLCPCNNARHLPHSDPSPLPPPLPASQCVQFEGTRGRCDADDPPVVGGLPLESWREHANLLSREVVPALRRLATELPRTTREGCPAAVGDAEPSDVALVDLTSTVRARLHDGTRRAGRDRALARRSLRGVHGGFPRHALRPDRQIPVDDKYFSDGLHPNAQGAALLARAIAQAVTLRSPPRNSSECAPCGNRVQLLASSRCREVVNQGSS